jgi:hypothetical protein
MSYYDVANPQRRKKMKINDLEKVNELVEEQEDIVHQNDEIEKLLECYEKYYSIVQVGDEDDCIYVDIKYIVTMFEQIKKDNNARIEKIMLELKKLGVDY